MSNHLHKQKSPPGSETIGAPASVSISAPFFKPIRTSFRVTLGLIVASVIVAIVWPGYKLAVPPAAWIFLAGFLVSCWCNILMIRGGYVGKASLVLWILICIFGLPPLGFFGMLHVLSKSIRNIEQTGKT